MSSKQYAAPLHLEIGASRWFRGLAVAAHGGAIAWMWAAPLPTPVKLVGSLGVALAFLSAWRSQPGLHGRVERLVWHETGTWQWNREGERPDLNLLPGAYVTPWCVILNFRAVGARRSRSLVLCPDGVEEQALRRLRVRLRLERTGYGPPPV